MKNIKKFKELNSSTYKSAADKFKEYGLNNRAKKLSDYSDEVARKEEFLKYSNDSKDFRKYGTFEIETLVYGVPKKFEVVPVFKNKQNSLECYLYGDSDFYKEFRYGTNNPLIPFPLFEIKYNQYTGKDEIEFSFHKNNRLKLSKIDRRNAIKLRNITIAYFNDIGDDDMINTLKSISVNEFYFDVNNEELKPSTYVSAAEKLLKKHPKRYRKLIDHAEKVELDENKLKHKTKLGYMDSNRFNIAIETYTYNSSSYTRSIEKYKNCALYIYFDYRDNEYNLNDAEYDVKDGGSSRGTIEFYLKFIPESYEDYIKLNDSDASYLYFYYNITKGSLELDENITLNNFKFTDRASSGRFLQIIKSIFDKKVKYGNDYSKDLAYDIEYKFLAETGVSSEYGLTMDDFIKVINKTSANKLYKEV